MVNPPCGSGADAQRSGARALSTLPQNTDATSKIDPCLQDAMTTDLLSESPMADRFLTDLTPRVTLPVFWRALLPAASRNEAHRMYVVGDGSCGTGAILLAIQSPDGRDTQPLAQTIAHTPRSIASFRTHEIKDVVSEWSEEHWCALMPMTLRDEVWEDRPRNCPFSAERTPLGELRRLLTSLDNPFHHSGNSYFFVVTHILKIGLLLITDDRRLGTMTRHLHDFGSESYDFSMVIYSSHHRGGATGHYETVGLFPLIDESAVADTTVEPATLFAKDHWLLVSLRAAADRRNGPNTLEAQRIHVIRYDEPGSHVVLDTPPTPRSASADPAPSISSAVTRPRRKAVLPHRYRDVVADHSVAKPQAARSLRAQFDAALAAVSARNVLVTDQPRDGDRAAQAVPRSRLPRPSEPAPLPAAAAPRHPPSTRLDALGARALTNLSAWLRENSSRNDRRMPSRVHRTAIPMWTNQCRAVLQTLAAALQRTPMDEAIVVGHLCVLWMLPTAVFSAPGRSRGGARGRRSRYHRIHHALGDRGLAGRLLSHVLQGDREPDPVDAGDALPSGLGHVFTGEESGEEDASMDRARPGSSFTTATLPDVRAVQRVEGLLRKGHSQRALRNLSSTTSKANLRLPSERAVLRQLHPTCPSNLPVCPADAPEVVVDLDWMSREMSSSDTGAAPGPSGWGSNHLEVLATDTYCVTALALIVQHIVNDALPATVRTILTTCCLVSLEKDDQGGRRPVAVGELLYRLAARYALSRVLHPAQKALRPHQFGMGEQDGCTQVVQSLQHLLTLPPASPPPAPTPRHQFAFSRSRPPPTPYDPTPRPLACLSIDITNAFNSINRAVVLREAYANHDLAPCWRMLAFGYGQPSLLMMQCGDGSGATAITDDDAFIRSENGVRQGDPLAALLFSLAMHPVYARLAELLHAGCFAFMDDGHGVGYLEECWKVWQLLPDLLTPLGLRLNPAKCEVTCFHMEAVAQHAADRGALVSFMAEGVKINDRCLRVLGCVVGANDECVAHELRDNPKFQVDQRVAFRRLPLMHKQTGMTALRCLTGAVLTNRLRAMTPASTAAHAAEYDACVLRAAHHLVGINAAQGDRYDEQLRRPLRIGGFGLISAVEIAPAAYLAGAACTLQSSPAFAPVWSGAADFNPAWPLYAAVADGIRRISETDARLAALCPLDKLAKVSASVLPTGAETFVQDIRALSTESCLLQSALTHRISTLSHIARVTQVERRGTRGHAELARLKALTEKESSLWLRVLPTEKFLELPDVKWQWAAHLRLGMEVPMCEGASALCEHTQAASEGGGWHPLCCFTQSSADINRRHHAVVNRIAHFSRILHIIPRTEPADLDPEKECRPDIQLDLPDVTLLGDVTISHPEAKKWQHTAASRGVETVGDSRQAEKDGLYTPMAEALDMQFSAIVLYTYGGFHRTALSFIRQLGRALDPATCLVSHTKWKQDLMENIAVAVQRGNADIMIHHTARLRGMAWPTRRTARSSRRRLPPIRCGRGRSSRRDAKVGAVGGVAGDRAAVLAARLITPPSPRASLFVPSCTVARDSDVVAGSDVDSDAATVAQTASHLDQMQVDTDERVPSTSCSVEFVPESPLGDACATDVDVEPAGIAAASVSAEPAAAAGRELQQCRAVVHAAVNSVNTVNTAVCEGVNGEVVDSGVHNVNRMRECEGRDDVTVIRGGIVAAEDVGEDAAEDGEVLGAPDVCELGHVVSDWGVE
jgi:hypothetical protein